MRESGHGETPKVGHRRWGIGVLLGAGILINYFDRVNISVAAPQLQQEFGLTPAELGLLFSAFFWSYAILQVPVGMVLDRSASRRSAASARSFGAWRRASSPSRAASADFRGARPARRRRSAGISGQSKATGYWFPRDERAGDGDLRRGGEILQRHRRAAGGRRHRQFRLALGLRPHGDPELRLFLAYWFIYRDPSADTKLSRAEHDYIAGGATPEGKSGQPHRMLGYLLRNRRSGASPSAFRPMAIPFICS